MAIKLGNRPEKFKPFPVKFTMPDGTEGVITATYKYRTRSEFGEMLDDAYAAAAAAEGKPGKKGKAVETPDGAIDFQKLYAGISGKNAEHLLKSLVAWDVEEELNIKNLTALADQLPAAAAALMEAYSAACSSGRLGN